MSLRVAWALRKKGTPYHLFVWCRQGWGFL